MIRPFIVWTHQRTGGTNLAKGLFARSHLPGTDGLPVGDAGLLARVVDAWSLHEPFSMGDDRRPFGAVTEAFGASGDAVALDRAIETVVRARVPMKHCVEMVPWPATEALARGCVRADYRHVFLYRRNLLSRALSRHFAERTGIWGPELLEGRAIDPTIFEQALPLERIVAHEQHSARRLRQTWELLTSAGRAPFAVAFEDIFDRSDRRRGESTLTELLDHLGLLMRDPSDAEFIAELLADGEQGTKEHYRRFSNVDALESALREVESFDRVAVPPSLEVRCADTFLPCVESAFVDVAHANPLSRRATMGGVVVLRDLLPGRRLVVTPTSDPDLETHVEWSIASPRIATLHPALASAASARFRVELPAVATGDSVTLRLRADEGVDVPLFVACIR